MTLEQAFHNVSHCVHEFPCNKHEREALDHSLSMISEILFPQPSLGNKEEPKDTRHENSFSLPQKQ